jgi:ABC-type lipoprotein export system ATPase subunit
MNPKTRTLTINEIILTFPWVDDFFSAHSLNTEQWKDRTFPQMAENLDEEFFSDIGSTREQFIDDFFLFIEEMNFGEEKFGGISSLTILPGFDKTGVPEKEGVTFRQGEVTAIVGPTGSGKSRLLEDIECLAQGDTPTKRSILVDEGEPGYDMRFSSEGRLIAQLSQNMNFIMDLSVIDFLIMHAESRMTEEISAVTDAIFEKANELAGEPFLKTTPVTQLSGGQSRALMIADTALLSQAPIILIDEIENAGVDKIKALELLVDNNKIVLIATHDPLLALSADQRIIIKNGGMEKVVKTSDTERANLAHLKQLDERIMDLRTRLRRGDLIEKV